MMNIADFTLVTNLGFNKQDVIKRIYEPKIDFESIKIENESIHIAKTSLPDKNNRAIEILKKALQEFNSIKEINKQKDQADVFLIGCTKGLSDNASKNLDKFQSAHDFSQTISSNLVGKEISKHYKIPYIPIANAACATSGQALLKASRVLNDSGFSQVILCMTESSLTPEIITGFNKLGVISKNKKGCQPFHQQSDGFTMGEGAAVFCLNHKPSHHEILNITVGNESESFLEFNIASTFVFEKIMDACHHANINFKELDYIHLHGTGTKSNDDFEKNLMLRLLEAHPTLLFCSTKHLTGHLLGSSGLVELALCFAFNEKGMLPGCQHNDNNPKLRRALSSECKKLNKKVIFANLSYGLGSTVSIIIGKTNF